MNENGERGANRIRQNEAIPVTEAEAREILGDDFLGSDIVQKVFGIPLENVPPIPFSREEIERARAEGQQLVLYTQKCAMNPRNPKSPTTLITPKNLISIFQTASDGHPMWNMNAIKHEKLETANFFYRRAPEYCVRDGWALVSKGFVPDAEKYNFKFRCVALGKYAQEHGVPSDVASIDNVARVGSIQEIYGPIVAQRTIYHLIERPVEAMYRLMLNNLATGKRLLGREVLLTSEELLPNDEECVVGVGSFSKNGICVYLDPFSYITPNDSRGHCFVKRSST